MSAGIRWFRQEDMDLFPSQDEAGRMDDLREMVDNLPPKERHIIERFFFGGATLCQIADELKVSQKHARLLRTRALERLRTEVLGGDPEVGPVPAAGLG